jgi:hypothetical protein
MNRLLSVSMMALCLTLMSTIPQTTYACDAKCEKKVVKKAKRYEKSITKVETKGCKTRPIVTTAEKSCARALKSLDKQYDKFKDEYKQHADIKTLRKRHEDLHGVLAGMRQQIEDSKTTSTFTQIIMRMGEACTARGEQTSCKKLSAQAMAQYDGFSSEIQKSNDVQSKLQKREEYIVSSNKLDAEYKERNANLAASNAASSLYVQTVGKVSDVLKMLRAGRDNNADGYFSYLTLPKKLSGEIKEFKNNCEGPFKSAIPPALGEDASAAAKHAARISAASTSSSNYPARIQEACELMANYDKYLATARVNLSNKHYDAEVLRLSNNIKGLKENGKTYHGTFSTLSYGFDDYKEKFRDDTSFMNLSMDRFDDVHDDFEEALEVALKMNDWDKVAGDEMNDGFEKSIKGYAKRHDLEFEKGAYRKDNTIYISKNGLGIPVSKYTHGYVMLKHDDESHYRMYNVTFYFDYLGGGQYATASSVKFKDEMMPVSD